MRGLLIAIEGIDGSGKGTQTALLLERLLREGIAATSMAFPQYGKKSAGLIEEYLNGHYGLSDDVSPRAASLFYALDRFDASHEIRRTLEAGTTVIVDRYVASNLGHQGGKYSDDDERRAYMEWILDIEHRVLGIPIPDTTVFLHVPAEIGKSMVLQKKPRAYIESGEAADILEKDANHLTNAEKAFLWLADAYPGRYQTISCYNGEIRSKEEIHELVWQEVAALLLSTSEHQSVQS